MKSLTAFICAILFFGCGSKMEMAPEATAEASPAVASNVVENTVVDGYSAAAGKLIKTANCRFEVENMDKSMAAIEEAMRRNNALMASSDLRRDGPNLEGKATVRVPADLFEVLLKEIDKQSKYVDFRDVRTEDVARQFVDLESRLNTKREVEQRYIEILRKKAGTIEELLNAEKQIGALHEEIEATIARLNYLNDEVRYSTINLEMYQTLNEAIAAGEPSAVQDMRQALTSGWHGLIFTVTALLYLWPFIVLALMGGFLFKMLQKRQRVG